MEISASSKAPIPFYALIAAAGSGSRLGGDIPKQYRKIGGKTVLRRTLETFLSCPGIQGIAVIIDPAHEAFYRESAAGLDIPVPIHGGKERNNSINNGIKEFSKLKNNDVVLIHDAARPFIGHEHIIAVAQAAAEKQAATLATPVTDTQKYGGGAYVDRKDLWAIQTPQGFHYGLIRKAHEQAAMDSPTDDTGLVAALGHDVALVPGPRTNIKITTPEDLLLAETLLGAATETRTGFGYDAHAFEPGDKVRLCGVDIPHAKRLKGHSDADAALHALTDALLGTIGAGDIGDHFPPSDPHWKNADSALFLQKALALVTEKGGNIVNVDLTLICEAPKISPHREKMQMRVAQLCGIAPDRVGIKATTNEGLGFIGRGEGIAAQAVATVRFTGKADV